MSAIAIEVRKMAERLRELFPEVGTVALSVSKEGWNPDVMLHRVGDYRDTTALMQRIGAGERTKTVLDGHTEKPWSTLCATVEGVAFTAACDGLPPSCKVVIESKKIPKSETVITGEFVEVFERRVVCGGEK